MNEGKVLVLNQDYSLLTICSIYRAFLLVYLGKAELLESDPLEKLHTVSVEYPMPSVIKVKRYIVVPYRGVVLTRYNVFKRDNHQCQYCGEGKELTLDHLIPRSKGGKTSWKNLVTACKKCNTHKGDLSLEASGMSLNRFPFKPSYLMFLKNNFGNVNKDWLRYLKSDAVA